MMCEAAFRLGQDLITSPMCSFLETWQLGNMCCFLGMLRLLLALLGWSGQDPTHFWANPAQSVDITFVYFRNWFCRETEGLRNVASLDYWDLTHLVCFARRFWHPELSKKEPTRTKVEQPPPRPITNVHSVFTNHIQSPNTCIWSRTHNRGFSRM